MNATVLTGTLNRPMNPPRWRLSRNAVIALAVVLLHIGLIWTLQNGLLMRTVELLVPVEVLAQLVEPPAPKPEPQPAPALAPVRSVAPLPAVVKKVAPKPTVRPQAQPQPAAITDPAPSPNAPLVSVAPPAPSPPVAETPAPPAAAAQVVAAAPAVQLPSSSADYLQNPKPAYPPLSKRLGEQGKVIVRVRIGADGAAQKAEIGKSSGFERLDQAALNTALKWRYVPGKRGGIAEDMWFNVPINFVLE